MNLRKRKIFAWVMFFSLLTFLYFFFHSTYQLPDYEEIANRITIQTAMKLEKQRGLYLIGIGGGMMHDIQMMHMGFDYFHEVDLKVARELVVYAVQEYLSALTIIMKLNPICMNIHLLQIMLKLSFFFANRMVLKYNLVKLLLLLPMREM